MQLIGIVLILLQAISLVGGLPSAPGGPVYAGGYYLGYFLPGIIGVILLIKGSKKKTKEEEETSDKQ